MRWKTGDKTYGLQKPTQHFVSQKRCIRFVITIQFSTAPAILSRLKRLVLLASSCFVKSKPKESFWPITSGPDNPVNQSELVAKHVTGAKGGKYVWDHGTFGVAFVVPDLVKQWREIQL